MIEIKDLKSIIENKIMNAEKVVIVPHINADFDAIGSALGLFIIAKKFKKPCYIIIDDEIKEPGVRMIVEESKKDYDLIKKDKYASMVHPDDLFILTDVNKKVLVSINDLLNNPENIVIIDHHAPDDNTIKTNYLNIDTKSSSASEIIVQLLNEYKIKIPSNVANYLYAGIYLDTAKLQKNLSSKTMRAIACLLDKGADPTRVNEFFKEDFLSDRRVQQLVSKTNMINLAFAISTADDEEIYTREELAKTADYTQKFGVDGSFAIGKIDDDNVSISGRCSNGNINIGDIMHELGGGGNEHSGASKINGETPEEVEKRLRKILLPSFCINK